jgi:hypothetical protein
MGPVA